MKLTSIISTALISLLLSAVIIPKQHCRATPYDFGGWLVANAHISLLPKTNRYQLYLEAQPRLGDHLQRAATFQGRAALVYNIDRQLGIYAGYAWTPLFLDSEYHRDYRDEQRFWQQIIFRHSKYGIDWQQRLRPEQRLQMGSASVVHRVRYMLRASYPLTRDKDLGLTVFDEVMYNINSSQGGAWQGYDRNRVFFGPYWLSGSIRYEVGYLGEHLKRFGDDERWAHVIAAALSFNLTFGS
jgi:hypothetical protein